VRAEQNEFLVRTGPGTPMGELFRRYWLPALLAEELPEPDCPPVRVKILGERLIAFRDTQNRLGLIDEFCAHRGVSLWFGRNEESGLRCSYHGWKYDVTGQCVEIPSEPDNPKLCQRMKLKSYPLVERGGVLWTYMGPAEKRPPLPEHEWAMVPASTSWARRWASSPSVSPWPKTTKLVWTPLGSKPEPGQRSATALDWTSGSATAWVWTAISAVRRRFGSKLRDWRCLAGRT